MESISCLQWDTMYPTWMLSDAIRSWDTMMQFCNYIQNGHATLSVFGLQHWVILLCNKHIIKHSELNELISFDDEEGLENSTEQVGSTRSTKVNLFHMVPLCYSSLENIPTQVSWGHATCNTRLGQRQCFSYHDLLMTEIEVGINEGTTQRLLGYANAAKNFIRSGNGDVWIRISKGDEDI